MFILSTHLHSSQRAPDDIFANTRPSKKKSNNNDNQDVKQMWIGVKEINELSHSTLEKKEQRKQRQEQLKALGAKGPKQGNIPLKILQGMRKKQKLRETKEREMAVQTGMIGVNKKSSKFSRDAISKKDYFNVLKGNTTGLYNSVGDGKRGIKPSSVGKYSDGVLKISREEIERVKNSRK